MKTLRLSWMALLGLAALGTAGCVERRTVYVPRYQPAPVYAPQPVYVYPNQPPTQAQPLVTVNPGPGQPPISTAPPPAPAQVVVSQAPPPPQVEIVPVMPGPGYVWVPGYWSWNGNWVWVSGAWTVRPRPRAVWVAPRWVHRPHGYVYMRGHWR